MADTKEWQSNYKLALKQRMGLKADNRLSRLLDEVAKVKDERARLIDRYSKLLKTRETVATIAKEYIHVEVGLDYDIVRRYLVVGIDDELDHIEAAWAAVESTAINTLLPKS